jgi:hypothetical protein
MLPVTWSGHKDPKTICAIDSRPWELSMSSSSCLTSKMLWEVGERRGILELVREKFENCALRSLWTAREAGSIYQLSI